MKKTDLAYIAGIVDGEGCISIHKYKANKTGNFQYDLRLKVSSTDEWLCQYLRMSFSSGQVKLKQLPPNTKQCFVWDWTCYSREAYAVIKLIYQYMNIKRPQADLAIKFQESKHYALKGDKGRRARTPEETIIEEGQFVLMKNLKKHKKYKEGVRPTEETHLK